MSDVNSRDDVSKQMKCYESTCNQNKAVDNKSRKYSTFSCRDILKV